MIKLILKDIIMWDIFQLIAILLVMFYFFFNIERKIEALNKTVQKENKALNQKVSGLAQLVSTVLRNQ